MVFAPALHNGVVGIDRRVSQDIELKLVEEPACDFCPATIAFVCPELGVTNAMLPLADRAGDDGGEWRMADVAMTACAGSASAALIAANQSIRFGVAEEFTEQAHLGVPFADQSTDSRFAPWPFWTGRQLP